MFIFLSNLRYLNPLNSPRVYCVLTTQTKEMTSSVTPYVCSKHPLGPYKQHPGILHPALDSGAPLAFTAFLGYAENQSWVELATFTTTTTQTAAVTHFIGRLAGDKTLHDSQARALPTTSVLEPPQLFCSTLHYSFTHSTEIQASAKLTDFTDMTHETQIISTWATKTFTFFDSGISSPSLKASPPLPPPFTLSLWHLSRSPSSLLIPPLTHSACFSFFCEPWLVTWVLLLSVTEVVDCFHRRRLYFSFPLITPEPLELLASREQIAL